MQKDKMKKKRSENAQWMVHYLRNRKLHARTHEQIAMWIMTELNVNNLVEIKLIAAVHAYLQMDGIMYRR